MKPTVYLGADHAGFDLKNALKESLELQGFIVEDVGAHALDPQDDYPKYAGAVAEAVARHVGSLGILCCGNAEGVCIAANKFDGIRAGIGYAIEAAKTMRADDDANILCLPGRIKTADDPYKITEAFLATPFSGAPRHIRRLAAVSAFEEARGNVPILPAVCANDRFDFLARIENHDLRAACPLWHIDILDGSLFDATCFADPTQLLGEDLPNMELHLMVKNPLPAFEAWMSAFPHQIQNAIFHAEIDRPAGAVIERIHAQRVKVGLALNPETPVELIHEYAREIDLLLLMGVHPGASGRPFLGEMILEKIQEAKRHWPDLMIRVDGGVRCETIGTMMARGADSVCAASALWSSPNPGEALVKLQKCATLES